MNVSVFNLSKFFVLVVNFVGIVFFFFLFERSDDFYVSLTNEPDAFIASSLSSRFRKSVKSIGCCTC